MDNKEKFLDEFYTYTEIGFYEMVRRGYIVEKNSQQNFFFNIMDIRLPKDMTKLDKIVNDFTKPKQIYLVTRYYINITEYLRDKYECQTIEDIEYTVDLCNTSVLMHAAARGIPARIATEEISRAMLKATNELRKRYIYTENILCSKPNTRGS